MAHPERKQQGLDHGIIGQTYTALGGMSGIVIAADTVFALNHKTGRNDVPMTRLRLQVTADSSSGWFKNGDIFDSYMVKSGEGN
jgi:hypothetical protein